MAPVMSYFSSVAPMHAGTLKVTSGNWHSVGIRCQSTSHYH
jgi:hypothetical protein